MVKNRVGKLETPQEHESFLRVMLGLVIVGLITPLLFKIITVAECIAIGVALVSIFIVWAQHIKQLKRQCEETKWYQRHLLIALNDLGACAAAYVIDKHKRWEWIEDLRGFIKIGSQTEHDGEDIRNILMNIREDFQREMIVLQSNHHIPPDIQDFVSNFRKISGPILTLDIEKSLSEMSKHIGKLLLLEWWIKDDAITVQRDTLSKLNTVLDKMTKELLDWHAPEL